MASTSRTSPPDSRSPPLLPPAVNPISVDGPPDELVRGVSTGGTPQAALNPIAAPNERQDIFNGICGAESASIPVSAVAPAMLVSEIETQRQAQGNNRPPILPPPGADSPTAKEAK